MAEITVIKTPAEAALAEAFGAALDALPGTAAVRSLREEAFGAFSRAGLPHRRVEEWKYTDLRTLMREARPLAAPPDAIALDRARLTSEALRQHAHLRLTLVDGSFAPSLSDVGLLPAGVRFLPLAEALASGDALVAGRLGAQAVDNAAVALNAAFMTDGFVLAVDAGVSVELPVLLQHAQTSPEGRAVYARSLIVLGEGASLTLVDTYEGAEGAANQTNIVIEVSLGDRARLERIAIQTESLQTLHLATLTASLGARAELVSFALGAGAAVARSQLFVAYAGDHATASLGGATLLAGKRHADTTLVVDHAALNGTSRELFKAVLDGDSRSVFQGKIVVRPGAQKTDGKMMSQAILLSDGAEVDNKPELEIFADDVVCGHGATCGALDEDLLFYCKARGIPQAEAEAILLQAFVGEAVEAIGSEAVRGGVMAIAERWLAARV